MQKFTRILLVDCLIFSASWANAQSLGIPDGEFQIQGLTTDVRLEAHLEVENSNNNDLFVLINCDRSLLNPAHQTYYCWALCYDTTVCNSPDPLIVAGRSTRLWCCQQNHRCQCREQASTQGPYRCGPCDGGPHRCSTKTPR